MNIGFGLQLEQKQKLIMTPELRQAIKILQLSSLELVDYINEMYLENPLIECKEEEFSEPVIENKKETEFDWEEYIHEMRDFPSRNFEAEEKMEFAFENLITKGVTIQEYLYSQLGFLCLNMQDLRAANYLIGNINSAGYLTLSLQQAAKDLRMEYEKVEAVLTVIQNFDPPGVGARTLGECLSLQLQRKGYRDGNLYYIAENHLEDIGSGKIHKLAQQLSLTVERVQELADIIKKLNPKPGSFFNSGNEVNYIVPDVIVEKIDEEYVIMVNDSYMPRLIINKTYSTILQKNSKADDVTKEFVENKLNQAMWLIRSIEQRKQTIYLVTEALLKIQRDFFEKGIRYLKPLTLKKIADEIGVHESTVSRATSNKYIQTPQGIFEFRFFFTSGVNTSKGESASAESIKSMIREIIKKEDAMKPYSDQKLADMLRNKGISIARRTVSKYREELGILNAGQRRRY